VDVPLHQYRFPFERAPNGAHITSKVLLFAQDGLVHVKLAPEDREERLDALFVNRLPEHLLEERLLENLLPDRVELGILDARRLLELGEGLGLGGDQRGARPEPGEVAANGARLEEFEAVVFLY
jgi:hypothetical protein